MTIKRSPLQRAAARRRMARQSMRFEALEARCLLAGVIQGTVYQDVQGDGQFDPANGDLPLADRQVFLDLNGNGAFDTGNIEPDDFADGQILDYILPGVRLTTTNGNNANSFQVKAKPDQESSTGEMVFSHEDIPFWNDSRRLRVDFVPPASSISIDVIGATGFGPEVGYLDLFDANGNLLEQIIGNGVDELQVEQLSATRGTSDIDYAIIYVPIGAFAGLDNLRFDQGDLLTTTASDGTYQFNGVPAGEHVVRQIQGPPGTEATSASQSSVTVEVIEGQTVAGIDFGVRLPAASGQPIAHHDFYNVVSGQTLVRPAPGLLANDLDPEADPLTAELVGSPQHGTLISLNADGSFEYQADAAFVGSDTFSYRVHDGTSYSYVSEVQIDVQSSATTSVSGRLYNDRNGNGTYEPALGESPLAGRTVYVDTNGDGQLSRGGVEPDDFAVATNLEVVADHVTLSVLGNNNQRIPGFPVTSRKDNFGYSSTGERVFAHAGVSFWNNTRRLRMDFGPPTSELHLDFISAGANYLGRLEAYDVHGNLLDVYTTTTHGSGVVDTMSILRPAGDISYAIAWPEVGAFGRLDNLRFDNPDGQLEASAVTSANGSYTLSQVPVGNQVFSQVVPEGWEQTEPQAQASHVLSLSEGVAVNEIDFGSKMLPLPPAVENRQLFYHGSSQTQPAFNRAALLPGQSASALNVSSYIGGITGLVVDVSNLADPNAIDPSDFIFRTGTVNDTSTWTELETVPTVTVNTALGVGGSDRIVLTWPAQTITNTWLEVTVRAGADTGLASDDLFYFGSQIGDTGGDGQTNATDFATIRANLSTFLNPATVDNLFDLNRDARVNAFDLAIVREHVSSLGGGLPMITPTGGNSLLESKESKEHLPPSDMVLAEIALAGESQAKLSQPYKSTSSLAATEQQSPREAAYDRAILLLVQQRSLTPTAISSQNAAEESDPLELDLLS